LLLLIDLDWIGLLLVIDYTDCCYTTLWIIPRHRAYRTTGSAADVLQHFTSAPVCCALRHARVPRHWDYIAPAVYRTPALLPHRIAIALPIDCDCSLLVWCSLLNSLIDCDCDDWVLVILNVIDCVLIVVIRYTTPHYSLPLLRTGYTHLPRYLAVTTHATTCTPTIRCHSCIFFLCNTRHYWACALFGFHCTCAIAPRTLCLRAHYFSALRRLCTCCRHTLYAARMNTFSLLPFAVRRCGFAAA